MKPVVATDGNQRQINRASKPRKQAKPLPGWLRERVLKLGLTEKWRPRSGRRGHRLLDRCHGQAGRLAAGNRGAALARGGRVFGTIGSRGCAAEREARS